MNCNSTFDYLENLIYSLESIKNISEGISDLNENYIKDIKKIPKGPYCYDENGLCSYWKLLGKYHEQEDGYCEFLGYGDWEINEQKDLGVIYIKGKSSRLKFSGHEIGLPIGLLWDQCKECGINEEEDI